MVWQEHWIHPHASGFRKKKGATDAAALMSLLLELHKMIQQVLHGFGLDFVNCFDLIPEQIVLRIAIEEGMRAGTHKALAWMNKQLTRCFKIMGCLCSFFLATNGILQCCPLGVILINLPTSVWKHILNGQQQAVKISAQYLPNGKPEEALHFIITALGYADDTYGVSAGGGGGDLQPPLQCIDDTLTATRQGTNAKKSVGFKRGDSGQPPTQLQGVPFPCETKFRSLGAGVRTTDGVASGPLILNRIACASTLLDKVHRAQGGFGKRSKIVATMSNATDLHAAESVVLKVKDVRSLKPKLLTLFGGHRAQGGQER